MAERRWNEKDIRRVAESLIEKVLRLRKEAENREISLLEMVPIDPLGTAIMLGIDVCKVGGLDGAEGALDSRTSSLFVPDSTSQAPARARRRFTIAHELGHYSLSHEGDVHHRVYRSRSESKPAPEQEADRFAVEFLTPASIVPIVFDFNFGRRLDHKKLSEDDAFLLSHDLGKSVSVAEFNRMDAREFAKRVAVAKWFGRQFDSMCAKFGVSIEAMAIRLMELELVY